ncbi:GNAT family N-acetyltransferase [Algoriphagus sp. AGSA1]|uniref:GNAT family N-acetyltransferase n=1 Tax=Algoriphagus sp. AGSA1 TaxID=2907213 RepID=UPI001F239648|nr:GNAT family N-acetyltransferase [Algoriphagus sp. AGSA1]MCE7055184.1 GNAT family N-acetyltransferase [Algoriphagus sp. AGSA1]
MTKTHQGKAGYRVWGGIDYSDVQKEIADSNQYKMVVADTMAGIVSVQYEDAFIWGVRDKQDATYLHRIAVDKSHQRQRLFEAWAKGHEKWQARRFVRMDTWADNARLIRYYQSFGFETVDEVMTGNTSQLPIQNRYLRIVMLQLAINNQE